MANLNYKFGQFVIVISVKNYLIIKDLIVMQKLTTGIFAGAIVIGAASAAYIPVQVGYQVEAQLQQVVNVQNAKVNSGFQIELLNYQRFAYSTTFLSRITLADIDAQQNGRPLLSLDIQHQLQHGFGKVRFVSELAPEQQGNKFLKDYFNDQSPLRLKGEFDHNSLNLDAYLDGFTLKPQGQEGTIYVQPAVAQLFYQQGEVVEGIAQNHYRLNTVWNGADLIAGRDYLKLRPASFKVTGSQATDYLWRYQSQLGLTGMEFGNQGFVLKAGALLLQDQFSLTAQEDKTPSSIHYQSQLKLQGLTGEQFGQTALKINSASLAYQISGPTVANTEALISASQQIDPEQMSNEQAQQILPLLIEFLQALNVQIDSLNVSTPEGSLDSNLQLQVDASQDELIQALSAPMLLTRLLDANANLLVDKTLVQSTMPLQMLAMQLYGAGAYEEKEDKMSVMAELKQGRLTINGVATE
ncbi:Uncharacterized conserved protein YdgA, DUF945 family [Oceanospirillum multiglobuliferum]|uniref:DUF945 domain-containing protein n=2 Tax=Oceanospirillum multiglobuliferum TaxID=64969 RepID=A0A1T4RPD3_9GAMM|nr:hypothetical protein BTE48_12835 [Oceanospirillum multiglobuliferum]SKA17839.1 Uncharacterized conserved protein YdgA, DUF945 family [Oceanospirillum multiglobuliferum]